MATGQAEADPIASETGMCRAAVAETGMPLEEVPGVPGDITDRALGPAAAAAPPAWDLEAAEGSVAAVAEVEVVAAGGAGRRAGVWKGNHGSTDEIKICEGKSIQVSEDCRRGGLRVSMRVGFVRCAAIRGKKSSACYRCLCCGAQ